MCANCYVGHVLGIVVDYLQGDIATASQGDVNVYHKERRDIRRRYENISEKGPARQELVMEDYARWLIQILKMVCICSDPTHGKTQVLTFVARTMQYWPFGVTNVELVWLDRFWEEWTMKRPFEHHSYWEDLRVTPPHLGEYMWPAWAGEDCVRTLRMHALCPPSPHLFSLVFLVFI